jgi:predicted small metal-binding protein
MAKSISCKDMGKSCDFVARGQNEAEAMNILAEHAKKAHGMKEISPEIAKKAHSVMREV